MSTILSMGRNPRVEFPGAYYHAFNRGVAKSPIVKDDQDRKMFLHLLGAAVQKFHVKLFVYCLMDNHFHCFLRTEEANLRHFTWYFQSYYAHYFNERHDRTGHLFQGRYKDRLVQTHRNTFALARYIHYNPVEAGMVTHPKNSNWSSYPCYIGKFPTWPWLDTSWLLQQFSDNSKEALRLFQKFHETPPAEEDKKRFKFRQNSKAKKGPKLEAIYQWCQA